MILHNDTKLISQTIRAASDYLKITSNYVEKDYWITRSLKLLSKSIYADSVVFKGGTSLSKGYGLIDRFSEDVDVAIIDNLLLSGNQIKTLIRDVEKAMTVGLNAVDMVGVSSKGSRFRKSIFEYPSAEKLSQGGRLIVEVNSFANPFPYEKLVIKSFITEFLELSGRDSMVEEYGLGSFELNILHKNQTLLEKLVSLIRFSYDTNPVVSIASKIRHFYDLYFLLLDGECSSFVHSVEFKSKFNEVLKHDKEAFDVPKEWMSKSLADSPLMVDFDNLWQQLKGTYTKELSALSFTTIPDDELVARQIKELFQQIKD